MAMIIKRRSERLFERNILQQARTKVARKTDTSDFERVARKFIDATYAIRKAMKETDSENNYDLFFGGFEQCDALLQDPAFKASPDAQYAYQLLLGADAWLKHEADKLGEEYRSPEHFFKCWDLENIDLRNQGV